MPPHEPGDEGVILETSVLGRYMKVVAIDPVTGIEAFVMGPASNASQLALKQMAIKKLKLALAKQK